MARKPKYSTTLKWYSYKYVNSKYFTGHLKTNIQGTREQYRQQGVLYTNTAGEELGYYETKEEFAIAKKLTNPRYKTTLDNLWRDYLYRDILISKGIYARLRAEQYRNVMFKKLEQAKLYGIQSKEIDRIKFNINKLTLEDFMELTTIPNAKVGTLGSLLDISQMYTMAEIEDTNIQSRVYNEVKEAFKRMGKTFDETTDINEYAPGSREFKLSKRYDKSIMRGDLMGLSKQDYIDLRGIYGKYTHGLAGYLATDYLNLIRQDKYSPRVARLIIDERERNKQNTTTIYRNSEGKYRIPFASKEQSQQIIQYLNTHGSFAKMRNYLEELIDVNTEGRLRNINHRRKKK